MASVALPTVVEWVRGIMERWGDVELHVRQDGKLRYLRLHEIKDQRVLAKYLADKLAQYRQRLAAAEAGADVAAGEEAEAAEVSEGAD